MRLRHFISAAGVLLFGLCTVTAAQHRLTNSDIVTLAKAGFQEQFIVDVIGASDCEFDLSAQGLAELARNGVNERVIGSMLNRAPANPAGTPRMQAAVEPQLTRTAAGPDGACIMPAPPPSHRTTFIVRPSRTSMTASSQTPYYEWDSFFWGLWRRKIGVGAVSQQQQRQPSGFCYGRAGNWGPFNESPQATYIIQP